MNTLCSSSWQKSWSWEQVGPLFDQVACNPYSHWICQKYKDDIIIFHLVIFSVRLWLHIKYQYCQTVPKHHLTLILWMMSDFSRAWCQTFLVDENLVRLFLCMCQMCLVHFAILVLCLFSDFSCAFSYGIVLIRNLSLCFHLFDRI